MQRTGMATQVPLPEFVQIEPVGQCNLKCRMCPVSFRGEGTGKATPGKPAAFMSFENFREIVDQFPTLRELQLQGMGEPFLHPRFFDMVRHAAARGIAVSTNTNLTALSPRRARECVESGLRKLHASIDAADAQAYEYIRVGSRLDLALRNLDILQEEKRRAGATLPHIILVAVVMRRNLDGLAALVQLAWEHGIRDMSVQHLAHDFTEDTLPAQYRPMRRFVDEETLVGLDAARIERAFDSARAAASARGLQLRLPAVDRPQPPRPTGQRGCDWPWRGAYVSYAGDAMPCCMIATPDRLNFGNMARDGVAAVWNNDAYQAFRAKLDSDDPPDICRGCAVYNRTF